ncbi:MAG: DNA helicase UvrD [Candidatus Diapherotrites archaeon]|nr:DNA helicase UvrD [Candidatus Diapherotrites archaeon]
MQIVADFHIHSKYSRATSKKMNVVDLALAAKEKGINLLGTGDFTHPLYLKELKQNLQEKGNGIYECNGMNFVLSVELSSIYKQGNKLRKIHQVILAPSFEVVDQINDKLSKHGRLDYDGRPIFGLSAPEIVDLVMETDKDCFIFPAHIWTPWFSLFGSNSGFDSIKECYQDTLKHIHALETGLSSDPPMNWRLSQLDPFTLVSFSDSHSPYSWRLGREATVFDTQMSYFEIIDALRKKDPERVKFTIEVDPAYGKYHWDGHRNCNVSLSPKETRKYNGICPVCHKPLTLGVEYRVEQLADRPEGFVPENAIPFKRLLPLAEILSAIMKRGIATASVMREYNNLVKGTTELDVLLNMSPYELLERTNRKIAEAVMKNREGKIKIRPGYDGVYGTILFDNTVEKEQKHTQKTLGEF